MLQNKITAGYYRKTSRHNFDMVNDPVIINKKELSFILMKDTNCTME